MSTIIVNVETDHADDDDAVRSVIEGMKRAGYDVLDHEVWPKSMERATDSSRYADGYVAVAEPDTDARMKKL